LATNLLWFATTNDSGTDFWWKRRATARLLNISHHSYVAQFTTPGMGVNGKRMFFSIRWRDVFFHVQGSEWSF